MNTPKLNPADSARLHRIQKTSRLLQSGFLIYFGLVPLVLVAVQAQTPEGFHPLAAVPAALKIYTGLRCAVYLLAAVAFSRLLELYEKGIIFDGQNVAHIHRLGTLAIFYGALTACRPIFETGRIEFPTLPLNVLCSPWLIMGCFLLIIAWVMDEGRKIREEQELTV
jgi:hypothetical protein